MCRGLGDPALWFLDTPQPLYEGVTPVSPAPFLGARRTLSSLAELELL